MAFERDLLTLALGAESTPGTAVTPTISMRIRNPDAQPKIGMEGEKFATGDHAQTELYSGEQVGDLSGFSYLSLPPAVGTAPDWGALLTSGGMVRTAHGSTGQSYAQRSAGDYQTLTGWLLKRETASAPQQLAAQYKGVMGAFKITASKRMAPFQIDQAFKGAWYADADISNGSIIGLGTVNTNPGIKLSGFTATVHGTACRIDSVEIDGGQTIDFIPDQSDSTGILHYRVRSAAPKLKLSIELPRVATINFRTLWTTDATGSVILSNGGSGATLLQFRFPVTQIESVSYKEIGGVEYADVQFHLRRNGSTDATMNAEDMWEILHGSKT